MFKLYPSIGKNAAVGAGTWSVNGGKERTLDIKRMFLKIVEKMLDDDVLLSKIQGLLKQYFVYIVPLLKTAGTERFNRNMRPAEVVDKYRALRPLRLRTEGVVSFLKHDSTHSGRNPSLR